MTTGTERDHEHPGAVMAQEMAEQPDVIAGLVARRDDIAATVAATLPRPHVGTVLVARGSSDYAAVYARYALEAIGGRHAALAAASLHTRYRVTTDLHGFLAVGVSQSGRTPEIVETLERMGGCGARTLAVTNDAGSPLADVADGVLALRAGQEVAVPATKTFTGQVTAFALLAEALGGTPRWPRADWDRTVDVVGELLTDVEAPAAAAEVLRDAQRLLSVGRGYLYAVALEAALKIAETTSMLATGWSPPDLLHGPIAVAGQQLHALCHATPGPTFDDVVEAAAALRARGATVSAVTQPDADLPVDGALLAVPAGIPEPLTPLVYVVRAQQLAWRLARLRGIDPDHPPGLQKVTQTR
ncbi:MAG: SIS domain-containing protein [Actinomycetota bacterium]|nr:SIS domain-containing protein [Actinomycetota bacterium]